MIALPPLSSILLPLLLSTTALAQNLHDNSQNCSCYVLNSGGDSSTPTYFQYYRFWDFRNIANNKPNVYLETPPDVNASFQNAPNQQVWDSSFLNSNSWNNDWGIQNWTKPAAEDFPTQMANSPANVYILQNNDTTNPFTYLTLRTTRSDDYQSSAEIENEQKNLMHCSMRIYARVIGAKGAVAGFFTFYDDSNESDIEILTDDPTDMIRYTNQPALDKHGNDVQGASLNPAKLAPWDQWQTHRIDWLPKHSYWYLNGQQTAQNTYSVPRKPSGLVLNMWSDGGEWSGNMTVGDSAEFQIQWVELIFNTSGPVGGPGGGNKRRGVDLSSEIEEHHLEKRKKQKGCEVVCKVDGVKEIGTPEVVSVNYSIASGISVSWGILCLMGIVSILVGM